MRSDWASLKWNRHGHSGYGGDGLRGGSTPPPSTFNPLNFNPLKSKQMKRISTTAKAIADNYIKARQNNAFTPVTTPLKTKDEVIQGILQGAVYEDVIHQIEIRFCSVTSILMQGQFNYTSNAYKSGVYKGFKALLDR
jgi:hypothetical protein